MKISWNKVLAFCLAFILFAGQTAEASLYLAARSTFLDGRNPAQSQNRNKELIIKWDAGTYRRDGVIGFEVPQGDYSDVTRATLRLFLTAASQLKSSYTITQAAVQVFAFDALWDEANVNWNSQPDFSGEFLIAEKNLPETENSWLEIDVTQYFQQSLSAGKHNLSFHLTGEDRTGAYIKLGGANHANAPQLEIERSLAQPLAVSSPQLIEQTLKAARSTHLDGAKPNDVNGNKASMIVKYAGNNKYRRDGVIGFDLPKEDYSNVKSAVVRLYITRADVKPPKPADAAAIEIYGFSADWKEKELNWENQPKDSSGKYEYTEDYIGNAKVTAGAWVEVDVTDYFQKHSTGEKLSFRLRGDKRSEVYLNISGALSGKKPELVLTRESSGTTPITGDTQVDVDVDKVDRKITMQGQEVMLKSLYVNAKEPNKNRDKTDTLLVGKEYSAYLYTEDVTADNPDSAFLRFYVQEDYKDEPVPVEIWGLKNTAQVGENTTSQTPAEKETEMIYELNITNQGWYSVDVTNHVKSHTYYGFYLKPKKDDQPVVKISSYNSEKTPVLYTVKGEDEFDALRKRFAIKKSFYDLNDPQIKELIQRIDERADEYLAALNKGVARTSVFTNYPLSIDSNGKQVKPADAANNMRNSYVWLNTLLRAYHTYGSKFENDTTLYQTIKDGLALLYEKAYNPFARENGNWWQWEIGVTKVLGEMIATMYEDLEPRVRMDYLNAIFRFQPNPEKSYYNRNSISPKEALPMQDSIGANRVDTCIADLLLGINAKNPDLIRHSVDALHDVYQYVTSGDGFYRDGSFIQHKNIPYTTAYGMVLISGLTELEQKLKQSRWKITDPDYQNVYAWLEESFIPMVFDGQAFPIVAGRSVSRQAQGTEAGNSYADGYRIARMLYAAAQGAPAEKKELWSSLALRYMEKNSFYDVKANASNIAMLKEYEELKQMAVVGEPYIRSHVFANMDRIVHHRGDYAIALAMYSSRIQNFEMMNGENLQGWNQGNGTLYLLNADSGQYDDAFWPTVDSYRLSGTTIDVVTRLREDHKEEFTMNSDFVGGVSLDQLYSTGAMVLAEPVRKNVTNYRTSLKANKSWFFFDDEVIALGSGISSTDDRDIETIVENRMIRPDAGNQVLINGKSVLEKTSAVKEDFDAVTWAYLEGNTAPSASIGYFFPTPIKLSGIKQKRVSTWKAVNAKGSDDILERNYLMLWQEHGKNPVKDSYSYAILPGKSADEVKAYAQAPHYEVLANSEDVQAVYEKKLGILAANVFAGSGAEVDHLRIDKPASVMVRQKDGSFSLSVADPTMKLNAPIRLTWQSDKEIRIDKSDANIRVINTMPLELEINLAGAKGKEAALQGSYEWEKPEEPTTPAEPSNPISAYQPPVTPEPSAQLPGKSEAVESEQSAKELQAEKEREQKRVEVFAQIKDIQASWAAEEIGDVVAAGILKGYADSAFRPEATVSRAETAQIISNLLDYLDGQVALPKPEQGQPWYQPAAERIKTLGIMQGEGSEQFYPEKKISRQELFTVLGRFGKWSMGEAQADAVLNVFADGAEVADYARPYVAQLVQMGLIKGKDGLLMPKRTMTRAELAVMLHRILKLLKG